jgi:rare lipoprotein A
MARRGEVFMITVRTILAVAVVAAAGGFAVAEPVTRGHASYYSRGAHTASGERYNPNGMTAAHRTLPFGTRVRVTDVKTRRSVVVRINDRGPFIKGRVIDISRSAANELRMLGRGVAAVELQVVR